MAVVVAVMAAVLELRETSVLVAQKLAQPLAIVGGHRVARARRARPRARREPPRLALPQRAAAGREHRPRRGAEPPGRRAVRADAAAPAVRATAAAAGQPGRDGVARRRPGRPGAPLA